MGTLSVPFARTHLHTYERAEWASESAAEILYLDPLADFATVEEVTSEYVAVAEGSLALDETYGLQPDECAYVELETGSAPLPLLAKLLDAQNRRLGLYVAPCKPGADGCVLEESGPLQWTGACQGAVLDASDASLGLSVGMKLTYGMSGRYDVTSADPASAIPAAAGGLCRDVGSVGAAKIECTAPRNAVALRLRDPSKMPDSVALGNPDGPFFIAGLDVRDAAGLTASVDVSIRITAGVNNAPEIDPQTCSVSENMPRGTGCMSDAPNGVLAGRDPRDVSDTLK